MWEESRAFGGRWAGYLCGLAAIAPAWAIHASAAPANGAAVRLVLDGVISPHCEFTEVPGQIALELPQEQMATARLGLACNLANGAPVRLSITSRNGGLRRQGGAELVRYSLSWSAADAGEVPVGDGPVTITASAPGAGQRKVGELVVRIHPSTAPVVAGRYGDAITYAISF